MKQKVHYDRVFDFGKYNQDTAINQGKVTEAFAEDNEINASFAGDKIEMKNKLKELKKQLRTEKVKARKYKDIYQKLKLQFEKSPNDQRLQGQVLASKEKIKEHITNYDATQKQIERIQSQLQLK